MYTVINWGQELQKILAIFKKYSQSGLFFLVISMSMALFLYGAIYLKFLNHTEDKIEENVVARFDSPTEYINNDSFWWIPAGKSDINLLNFSTSPYQGVLYLYIQNNPCKNSNSVKLGDSEYLLSKDYEIEISQKFDIKSLDQKVMELTVFNYGDCKLDNGDSRNFGIRINGWKIDAR
jgi:hypothetical protein